MTPARESLFLRRSPVSDDYFNRPRAYTPTVTLEENTIDSGDELVVITVEAVETKKKTVTLTVAAAGYWLLRIWLTDGADVTEEETIAGPDIAPSATSFFKTTNELGVATFNIEDSVPGSWYVQAAVCGKVDTKSNPVVVGV